MNVASPEPPPLARPPAAPCRHPPVAGSLDESARRLSHEELAVARHLAGEGHHVRSVAEGAARGPTADLLVCGEPVEVKAFLSRAGRDGYGVPSARSVYNKVAGATARQAREVVVYARGSGLAPRAAQRGMAMFAARHRPAVLPAVRVLGDGFDLRLGGPGLVVGAPGRAPALPRWAPPPPPDRERGPRRVRAVPELGG